MKAFIAKLGEWGEKNWLSLVIIMGIVLMFFVCAIMASWLIGYWANALYGMHFELSSCWSGIGVVVTGLGGIVGLAKAAWTKYGYDSRYNTPAGIAPVKNPVTPATAAKVQAAAEKVVETMAPKGDA